MKKIDTPGIVFEPEDDIPSAFRKAVKEQPEKIAVIFKDRRVSLLELGTRINRVANTLLAQGIKTGDRVSILSRNSVEYIEVFFGTLTAGGCAVPLPTMASTEALKLMIEDSRSKILVVSSEMRGLVEPFIRDLDHIEAGSRIGFYFEDEGWLSYEKWIEGASGDAPEVKIGKDDDFNIIYSSGTTGEPKGIIHTHAVRRVFTDELKAVFSIPGMVNIISTPLYSNTTMVTWLPSMRCGTTIVLMDKFDEREFLKLCERDRATLAMLVPVQYQRILRVEDLGHFDLSSLLVKFCTSAPLHADVKKQILDRIPGELVEIYGLTEGGVGTVLIASQNRDKLGSVGQPAPGCEIKVIDEEGNELPPGETGEIVGRYTFMMKGYQSREDATNAMLWYDKEGRAFYRSGDIGRMDEESFVYVLDRKKDVIISGGLNIYAVDLERELLKHEAVLEAAVIGVPDDRWGETPLALVVMEKGVTETPESIREWANTRLGKSQRISKVEFRDELPKGSVGKILKKELRRPYWEKG
ncbi:MAG: AMP-binding protein [Deltaproteobacteria bacterium]|nr:MAG: AMP-binding protein [Deltaproteobacteria bacterium]